MKRVAYVLGTFPALTETFILGEIQAVRGAGVDLHLFALRRPSGTATAFDAADLAAETCYGPSLRSRRLWQAHVRFLQRSPGRYLRTLGGLLARTVVNPVHCLKSLGVFAVAVAFAEVVRERGIEHVHAHWANYPATAAYLISRMLGIPYSFTAHAYDASLIRAMMREKVRRAAFVITCTRHSRRFLESLAPEAERKIWLNYHGVFLDRFSPNGNRIMQTPDTFRILSVGSLFPRKGFGDLLEACRVLRDRNHRFECTIIGEGPLRPALERSIRRHGLQGRVRLAGALPQPDVIRHYRAADLFVLPCSTDYLGWDELFTDPVRVLEVGLAIPFRPMTDGIPNVLLEAMAMGIPVVSTSVAGVPELIEDGRTGLLVPEKNPMALAGAIERLLPDTLRRQELAQNARETVCRRFDRRRNVRELVTILSAQAAGEGNAGRG